MTACQLIAISLASILSFSKVSYSQNVGIGTSNPQSKLHVAGGIRVDALAGPGGFVTKNASGELASTDFTGNVDDVMRGNGEFAPLSGIVPASGVLTSKLYYNTTLLNAGYSLVGEIPQVATYTTYSTSFPVNSWATTYTRGVVTKVSAPEYNDLGNFPLAASTGSIMYVMKAGQLYSYDRIEDSWTFTTSFSASDDARMVWTGTELLIWGGSPFVTASRYNPATSTLTAISAINAPSPRTNFSAVWTGSRLIVWGGAAGGVAVNTGGIYDPATNTWVTMSIAGAPAARQKHVAVWSTTVNRMIVWGGATGAFSGELDTGAQFDPATNSWTGATNTTGTPAARIDHSAVWTGVEMIVFGGSFTGTSKNDGARYNPASNTWTTINVTGAPTVSRHAVAWDGSVMYVTGGSQGGTNALPNMYKYDPVLNSWTFAGFFSEGKWGHHCFYMGDMLLIWGGRANSVGGTPFSSTGFRYFLTITASSETTVTNGKLYLYQKN